MSTNFCNCKQQNKKLVLNDTKKTLNFQTASINNEFPNEKNKD